MDIRLVWLFRDAIKIKSPESVGAQDLFPSPLWHTGHKRPLVNTGSIASLMWLSVCTDGDGAPDEHPCCQGLEVGGFRSVSQDYSTVFHNRKLKWAGDMWDSDDKSSLIFKTEGKSSKNVQEQNHQNLISLQADKFLAISK